MKIFLVGTAYPMRGGIAHYIALLYQKLKEAGHDIKIISFKRQYPKLLFPGKTQEDQSKEIIKLDSEPLIDSINPFTWFKVFFKIRTEKPDIIVYKYWMTFFAPCYGTIVHLTRWFTNSKSLFLCDNIIPHERRFFDGILIRWGLRKVDYFIIQSKSVREDLLTYKPDATFKEVPHPVYEIFKENYTASEARTKLSIAPAEKVLLFFGYIRAYKGLNFLIDALPIILKKFTVRLIIAGEFYEGRTQTINQIKKLYLEKFIILKDDYIPNEDVGLYFAATDVVVLPYVSATQSGIIQIAYNYNKPVITTNVGGLPEVIKEGATGYIVPARSASALAEAIFNFFQVKHTINFAEKIQEHKKQYSWDRLAEAIINFSED